MCDLIENIFSPVVFASVTISSMNICVNVFELREVCIYNILVGKMKVRLLYKKILTTAYLLLKIKFCR